MALIAQIGSKNVEVGTESLRDFFDTTVCFAKGITEMTSQKKFSDAQKIEISQPIKKVKKISKKIPDKNSKQSKKKFSKKVIVKSYKLNPHAKFTGGFGRF